MLLVLTGCVTHARLPRAGVVPWHITVHLSPGDTLEISLYRSMVGVAVSEHGAPGSARTSRALVKDMRQTNH